MDAFYIELSSNASYYTNTCADFKNRIKLLHSLEGDWEIGIAEISYTKSWHNLRYHCTMGLEKMHHPFIPFISIANTMGYVPIDKRIGVVRRGYYDSIPMLINEIDLELEAFKYASIEEMPKFYYDDAASRLVSIKPGIDKDKDMVVPALTKELSEMLGFYNYSIEYPRFNQYNYIIADRPPDLTNGIRTLFIYCNLVLPQYIGDVRAKLLKTVEIPNEAKFGDQVVVKYDNPHYVPLMTTEFEEIEINIRDDMDEVIRFTFGRTRIKLHLRKIT